MNDELYNRFLLDLVGKHKVTIKNSYEHRVVATDEGSNFTLDTVFVLNKDWLYEVAVSHEEFAFGDWLVLDITDTKSEALNLHHKWLNILSKDTIKALYCYESDITFIRNCPYGYQGNCTYY